MLFNNANGLNAAVDSPLKRFAVLAIIASFAFQLRCLVGPSRPDDVEVGKLLVALLAPFGSLKPTRGNFRQLKLPV